MNARGDLRHDLDELGAAVNPGQTPPECLGGSRPNHPLENGDPRRVGDERLAIATPDQHRRAHGNPSREFQGESGLADAGLSGDEDDLLLSCRRALPGPLQELELPVASRQDDGLGDSPARDPRG